MKEKYILKIDKLLRTPFIKFCNLFGLEVDIKFIKKIKMVKGNFINVGAGTFNHPNWINVDKISKFYKSSQNRNIINFDLLDLKPLPFKDNSIDLIYTAHTIEHVTDEAVSNLFKEAYKKLKKGGIIRITCPDMLFLFNAYKRNDESLLCRIPDYGNKNEVTQGEYDKLPHIDDASIQQKFLWCFARQSSIHHNKTTNPLTDEQVDKLFKNLKLENAFDECVKRCDLNVQKKRPEEHISWWTEDKLIKFLKKVGFKNILKSRFNQSISPFMRDPIYFDHKNISHHSLYIEAIKD